MGVVKVGHPPTNETSVGSQDQGENKDLGGPYLQLALCPILQFTDPAAQCIPKIPSRSRPSTQQRQKLLACHLCVLSTTRQTPNSQPHRQIKSPLFGTSSNPPRNGSPTLEQAHLTFRPAPRAAFSETAQVSKPAFYPLGTQGERNSASVAPNQVEGTHWVG